MDLNYLFHRQQVERSRAVTAASEAAGYAHARLAREYEMQIRHLTDGNITFPADRNVRGRTGLLPWLGVAAAGAAIIALAYLQSR